jgi:hypothetical protein
MSVLSRVTSAVTLTTESSASRCRPADPALRRHRRRSAGAPRPGNRRRGNRWGERSPSGRRMTLGAIAERIDHPRRLVTDHARRLRRVGIQSPRRHHISKVQPGRTDSETHLPRARDSAGQAARLPDALYLPGARQTQIRCSLRPLLPPAGSPAPAAGPGRGACNS